MRRELLLGAVLRHAPREHLPHGGEVVLGRVADLEAAVVGLLRRAALEDHHRRDGVRLAKVRDVEALDPHWQLAHAQLLLQAVQRLDALVAAALGLQPVLVQRQPRVALGQLEDPPLVSALGGPHLHRPAALGRQRLLQRPHVLEAVGHDHPRRDGHCAGVVLEQELLEHLGLVAARLVLQVEALAVGQHAVAHLEHLGVGRGVLGRHGDRIQRAHRLVGHALALQQRAHRPELVTQLRRRLELLVGRRGLHPLLQLPLDLAVAPGQEGDDRLDVLAVLLLGHVPHARRLAALDEVVQARAARLAAGLLALAGAVLEHLAQQLERLADALGAGERAEVDPVAAVLLAGEDHPRVVLLHRHGDVGVGLVVAEPHVVAGTVALDEVLLGQQRLGLGLGDQEVELVHRMRHLQRAAGRRLREVSRHAFADRGGLPHVDDLAPLVLEQVDAGRIGQRQALAANALRAALRVGLIGGGHRH